ncbi:hypothetical protein F2P44_07300 [Massilia sp. CCM 8695]|uniref:Uncharacterized protein n=1 Tax=Massilia frigida TaxID=2609281 RepID=A0ABX0N1C0_9BURK|nr:hypothetical protein [Massilia frigida]
MKSEAGRRRNDDGRADTSSLGAAAGAPVRCINRHRPESAIGAACAKQAAGKAALMHAGIACRRNGLKQLGKR